MINLNDEMNSLTSKTARSNSALHSNKLSRRPKTPHINLFSEEELQVRTIRKRKDSEDPQNLIKNFSAFMKGIIDSQNENFLSGDTKVIGFIISKYLKMDLDEINQLQKLSIKINSDFGLLNSFGEYLPNLRELKLKDSQITSISECGTSFRNLKILNVTNCGLKDLSGLICFSCLEEVEAADNSISDLFEIEMCTSLKKINLKKNLIEKEENILFLGNLLDLTWLNLLDNPIRDNKNYHNLIKEILPQLIDLDQEEKNLIEEETISDKKFFESHSTFSSSPCSSTNKTRPISSTYTNFFKNKLKKEENSINFNNLDDTTNNSPSFKKKILTNESFESLKFSLNSNFRGKSTTKLGVKNDLVLKPVIKKKEQPFEINSFRQNVEDKLKTDLIKTMDKQIQSNTFKLGKLNIERGRIANTLGKELSLKSPLKINFDKNKHNNPLKLKASKDDFIIDNK